MCKLIQFLNWIFFIYCHLLVIQLLKATFSRKDSQAVDILQHHNNKRYSKPLTYILYIWVVCCIFVTASMFFSFMHCFTVLVQFIDSKGIIDLLYLMQQWMRKVCEEMHVITPFVTSSGNSVHFFFVSSVIWATSSRHL